MNTRTRGQAGEDRATRFLQAKGYRVLERNFSALGGEIDLILSCGKTLVFAEVKTRSYEAFGGPLSAVTPAKQKRIAQTAALYIKAKGLKFDSIRFDVVCVLPDRTEHVENAFSPGRTTL